MSQQSDISATSLVPRGPCPAGENCEFEPCLKLDKYMTVSGSPNLSPNKDFVPSNDPEELILISTGNPINDQSRYDRAFEIFAKVGNVDGALRAAELLTAGEPAINRLMQQLPRTDEVYRMARKLANSPSDPRQRLYLNETIALFERQDRLADKAEFFEALEARIRQRRAARAATIVAHEEVQLEVVAAT